MRFMIIVKATKDSEAGVMPEEELIAEMAMYHEALAKAGAARCVRAPGELEGLADQVRRTQAHRDRRPLHRDEGADRGLHAHPGEVEGRGTGMDQALPQSRRRRQGRRDRGPPAVRARGLRSQRSGRALSRHGRRGEQDSPDRSAVSTRPHTAFTSVGFAGGVACMRSCRASSNISSVSTAPVSSITWSVAGGSASRTRGRTAPPAACCESTSPSASGASPLSSHGMPLASR